MPRLSVICITVVMTTFLTAFVLDRVSAQAKAALDPVVAVLDADPLELARVTRLLGDAEITKRLGTGQSTEVRLAAARAARFMRQPEVALMALSELAGERDGVLAQAAVRAVLIIVRELDVDVLSRREVDPQSLAPVRELLKDLASREHLRTDLRADMNAAFAMLTALVGS